jgi:hypothetical protein
MTALVLKILRTTVPLSRSPLILGSRGFIMKLLEQLVPLSLERNISHESYERRNDGKHHFLY